MIIITPDATIITIPGTIITQFYNSSEKDSIPYITEFSVICPGKKFLKVFFSRSIQ